MSKRDPKRFFFVIAIILIAAVSARMGRGNVALVEINIIGS